MARGDHQWLRLYVDVLDSPKVQRLPADVFRTWVNLLALYKREGEVMPSPEDVAWALRMRVDTVLAHLDELVRAGLLEGDDLTPHNWDARQFASDTSAERMARHRARKRDVTSDGGVTSHVTASDVTSDGLRRARKTDSDTETDSETEKSLSTASPPRRERSEPPEFIELRRIYPKRAGDQGWPRALQACHARIREGCTWRQIIDGAERYAAFLASTGKVGTEYVKQAATFCGPQRAFLEPWIPPGSTAELRLDANAATLQAWLDGPPAPPDARA